MCLCVCVSIAITSGKYFCNNKFVEPENYSKVGICFHGDDLLGELSIECNECDVCSMKPTIGGYFRKWALFCSRHQELFGLVHFVIVYQAIYLSSGNLDMIDVLLCIGRPNTISTKRLKTMGKLRGN